MTAREIDFLAQLIRDVETSMNKRFDALDLRLMPLEQERQQRIGATTAKTASALTRKERLGLIVAVIGGVIGFIAQVVVPIVTTAIKTAPTH